MSISKRQNDAEFFILGKFLSTVGIEPDNIERGPNVEGNSKPDFIVTINGRKVGIEETTYYQETTPMESYPRQAKERHWSQIQEIITDKRRPFPELNEVHGFIKFRDFTLPSGSEYDDFASEVIQFALSKLPEYDSERRRYLTFEDTYPRIKKYVECFELKKVGCYMFWDWMHNSNTGQLTEGELSAIIKGKIEKHVPCELEENWLLITSQTDLSQYMGRPIVEELNDFKETAQLCQNGPFHKTYIFQYMFSRVLLWTESNGWKELKPARFSR